MSEEKFILTERELHIIRLLKKDYSQKMIAGELNIGIETVRTHLKHIRLKLGCHSVVQVINWAYQHNIH